MEIKISWDDFQGQLKGHIQEGESLLEELKALDGVEHFKDIIKRCNDWSNEAFKLLQYQATISDDKEKTIIEDLHNMNWATTQLNQVVEPLTENNQSSIEKSKQNAKQVLNQGVWLLNHIQTFLSAQDRVTGKVDQKELERRKNFDTEEKEDFLLEKLYELNDGNHYPVKPLLEGNGIFLSSLEEPEGLITELEGRGLVEKLAELGGSRARITVAGSKEVEQKRKTESQNTEGASEDKEELHRKIDEILERVRRQDLGQEVLYDDLSEEMEDLKEKVDQVDRKTLGDILKGKLVELGAKKAIDGTLANWIYETVTNSPLSLPWKG